MFLPNNAAAESAPAQTDPYLIFLHIPKTAGITLWLILRRQYSPRAVLRSEDLTTLDALSSEQAAAVRVILGHIPFSVHEHLPRPATYITVLRDPLERVLSRYCHLLRDFQCGRISPAIWAPDGPTPTISDYLASDFDQKDNWQTRMLAGPEAMALPMGACDRDVFEQAKRNIETRVAVAGLTERFDETVVLLQRRFGWNLPCYVRENVGTNRLSRRDVSREDLKTIWQQTQWDRKLYALAAERFEEQVAAQGPGFPEAVCRFQVANMRYARMKRIVSRGPLAALKRLLPLTQQMELETAVRAALRGTTGLGTRQPVESSVLAPQQG